MMSRGLVAAACAAAVVNGGLLSRRHDNFRAHYARLRQQTINAKRRRPQQPRPQQPPPQRARDAQGVAAIVTGAARAFARSAEIRDALKSFIVANGATPFFAVHLEDSCSGSKFYPGHQRRLRSAPRAEQRLRSAPGAEQRLRSGNPYANVS